MARIRTIKPEFFTHWELFDLERETGLPVRLAFAGLWTQADREGRFQWIPQQLKLGCLPYDDVDFSRVLHALATRDFIKKYTVDGREFGVIPGFLGHQVINNREKPSILPDPSNDEGLTRAPRVDDATTTREVHAQAEGKGREGKGRERKGKALAPSGACPSAENSTEDASHTPDPESLELQPPEPDAKKNTNGVPYQKIVDLYHEHLPELRQVVALNQARKTAIKGRWHNEIKSLESFAKYFSLVAQSDFLTGKCNPAPGRDSPWQADFDWLMKPSNVLKIVEGKYRD